MNQWITAADVRTFAGIEGTAGRYSDAVLGSNIQTAQALLQRRAHRLFALETAVAKTFSTEGRAQLAIPDLRSATSVTKDGTALVSGESYWLIEDARQSGVYVAIQLRVFGQGRQGPWWLGNPDWFDRGLDLPPHGWSQSGEPNDLVITGNWGWDPLPYDVLHGVKAMAAWLTKRGDAVLAGAVQTPDGSVLDYSQWPPEAQAVIREYGRGTVAVII